MFPFDGANFWHEVYSAFLAQLALEGFMSSLSWRVHLYKLYTRLVFSCWKV